MSVERWYEIVGYFDPQKQEEVHGTSLVIKGDIDDVIIVHVPADLDPSEAHHLMQQAQTTMMGAGIDRHLVLMPDNVKLMKARKLPPSEVAKIKALSRAPGQTRH